MVLNVKERTRNSQWISITCILLFCFSAGKADTRQYGCEPHLSVCDCHKDEQGHLHVDCSHKELCSVPTLPLQTVYLDLSLNNISFIEKETFTNFTQLASLNLSTNVELKFEGLRNVTYGLQFTPIKELNVIKIHDTYGLGTLVAKCHIEFLKNTTLTTLYMDSNRIEMIDESAVEMLPKTLQFLSVTDNKFTYGKYMLKLSNLPNLRIINASNQYSAHIPWSKNRKSIAYLNKSNAGFIYPLPPSLERLLLADSKMTSKLPAFNISHNNTLRYADVSGNMLYKWEGPIGGIDYLTYFDLSRNYCSNVSSEFFKYAKSLRTLKLSDNLLGLVLREKSAKDVFRQLTNLHHLDLSHNRIDSLPGTVFSELSNLRVLNISRNQLTTPDNFMERLENLVSLDISYNLLPQLSEAFRNALDMIIQSGESHNRTLVVNLTGNRIQCQCHTLDFLTWLQKSKITFPGLENITCETPWDERTLAQLDTTILQLLKYCTTYVGLIVGLSCGLLFFLGILVSGIVYRYRWKLRYLYFMTKNKHRGYSAVPDDEQDDFRYDAFISYADEELRFVKDHVIANLERQAGLSLCIHNRDFLPEREIAANITDAIHGSRKTIVILTRHYLKSYWCMYELNMARMEAIHSGRDVLLLVMMEQIPRKELSLDLLYLIQSESYIEYPNDPHHGNIVFWDKVKEAVVNG